MRAVFRILLALFVSLALVAGYFTYTRYTEQTESCRDIRAEWIRGIASSMSLMIEPSSIDLFVDTDASLNSVRRTSEKIAGMLQRASDMNDPDLSMQVIVLADGLAPNIVAKAGNSDISAGINDLPPIGSALERSDDDWVWATYPVPSNTPGVSAFIQAGYPLSMCKDKVWGELKYYMLLSAFVLCLTAAGFLLFVYRTLEVEEKVKAQLRASRDVVEARNSELLSSLRYAGTIQESMRMSAQAMEHILGSHLLVNRPKEIVSGDFFWVMSLGPGRYAAAVADCTGHGVPGALLATVAQGMLNDIFKGYIGQTPDALLERFNTRFMEMMHADSAHGAQEGMDIAMCIVDRERNEVLLSSARRPVVTVSGADLKIIKGTRRSIGQGTAGGAVPFNLERFAIRPGMRLFLFSDGITDQFGGKAGRKLMVNKFGEWLAAIGPLGTGASSKLEEQMVEWMQGQEQSDDICVLGIQL
jgi:serine phosphatase RsbU (regulator of sigma subunit)